ncbi:MAG: hypothetical protein ACRD2O_00660 [Terriglobia bacterium]
MQRSAVVLARCVALVETYDLSPDGRVFYPDLVRELVSRYQFQKFPKDFSQIDEAKGVEFLEGKYGDDVIWNLTIYNMAILLDTRSNTTRSREIVEEALEWGKATFGLKYEPGMIKRFGYVSQVTFYSDATLDMLHPALKRLVKRVSDSVSNDHQEEIEYQTTQVGIHHDHLKRKSALAGFTIAPRVETPLSDHKYFSEAPLQTDLHWELLEEFEAGLLSQK